VFQFTVDPSFTYGKYHHDYPEERIRHHGNVVRVSSLNFRAKLLILSDKVPFFPIRDWVMIVQS
jgi:hypothetical protein